MYDYLNQPVITSMLCFQRDSDSFFAPVTLQHTGFAFDGVHYSAGVPTGGAAATWSTEGIGPTRGPLATFPTAALILVSSASLTIMDTSSNVLALWMTFYLADDRAYASNPLGFIAGYTASSVTWANGLLSIVFSPDPGSLQGPSVVTIDFVQDSIYIDLRVSI